MSPASFKFTKERLLALPTPAPGARATYRDTEAGGLELRVSGTGAKSFSWYRRIKNGQPERVTLGRFPEVTVQQARAEADRLNAARVAGDSPAATRRTRRQEQTFAELFGEYIQRHAKAHKKTWKEDQQRFDQYLASSLGRHRLSAVTRDMISKLHADITSAGHPVVANRVLALVSSVFGRAIEWSRLEVNPAKGVRRNRETSRDRFLRSDELPRFFASVNQEPNEVLRDAFLMMLFTGARRANVLAMAWEEIDDATGTWRIPDTKNGEPLVVPLTAPAVSILAQRRDMGVNSRFVFPGYGDTGHVVEPRKAWVRIFDRDELAHIRAKVQTAGCGEAELSELSSGTLEQQLDQARKLADSMKVDRSDCRLPQTRIHDLRRTMGSWQANTGASLAVIGKSLGHKNRATTDIYARLQVDPVREAMGTAAAAMLSAGQIVPKFTPASSPSTEPEEKS